MVSERASATTPFEAMEVLERANELDDIIHLEVGEPDYPTPTPAIEAAVDSLRAGNSKYTEARGKPELRNAIAAYYDRRYGVDISTDRIVVTPGSSPALFLTTLAVLDPGDRAVLTNPYYACYPNFIRQAGGELDYIELSPTAGFAPDLNTFSQTIDSQTELVLVNSPANPTGAVLSGDALSEISQMTNRANAVIVSDEAYHGLAYGNQAHTILEYTDEAFVIDSFSKRFSMTGWRLGWTVVPPDYVDLVNRLAQNLLICAPNFVQDAGIAALATASDHVPEMRETYRDRRDVLLDAVEDLGLSLNYTPGGAYYLLVDVRHLGDAFDVSETFLEQAGVATTPGRDFGDVAAPFIRLSYATGIDQITTAIDRIDRLLETTTH